ncbi:MAG: PhzF family phenazine biosynthesis protein [Acidobacteria bacterium]|nr:PhzF family phenazine biosynthesis protein [Acidobacteriota bacterium]
MELDLYQLDAFTNKVFQGNPAAICPLNAWLPDTLMQAIAAENNLSETAFFVPIEGGYHLRWFTPVAEVDLCGHATLATAALIFHVLGDKGDELRFNTRSGWLNVRRQDDLLQMDLPALPAKECEAVPELVEALGVQPLFVGQSRDDYLVVIEDEAAVRAVRPDFKALSAIGGRGVLVTGPGNDVDFVSRCFFPAYGIDEDPVTGSAHCTLAPYWADRLGKNRLTALQCSQRAGKLICQIAGDRVLLLGTAKLYLKGKIWVGD